ncbi:MAG: hypothetical protein ABJK64_01380 [Paraglaciecola sp.]|uniref:hypothetical protein n=1 Tax=Paraglaciecola sp. TaxID=1920173 RepID=UPI003298AFEF
MRLLFVSIVALTLLNSCANSGGKSKANGFDDAHLAIRFGALIHNFYLVTGRWPDLNSEFTTDTNMAQLTDDFGFLKYDEQDNLFLVEAQFSEGTRIWQMEFSSIEGSRTVKSNMKSKESAVAEVPPSFSNIFIKSSICVLFGISPNDCNV